MPDIAKITANITSAQPSKIAKVQDILEKGMAEEATKISKLDIQPKGIDNFFKASENQGRAMIEIKGRKISSLEEAFIAAGGKFDD